MTKNCACLNGAIILTVICLISLSEVAAANDASTSVACKPISEQIKLLVLTYRRSGSSYVGELLASQGNASYYFEPIYYSDNILNNQTSEGRRDFLRRIMTCDMDLLDAMRTKRGMWIVRKYQNEWSFFRNETHSQNQVFRSCICSPIQVFKTIRLRLAEVVPMLDTMPNLKIVHLVRDPRARYASAGAPGGSWAEKEKAADTICSEMQTDLKVHSSLLNDSNYLRIRYEDIVADPVGEMRALYRRFLGSDDVASNLTSFVNSHTASTNDTDKGTIYYSTFRPSSFDPNHWKTSLSPDSIKGIQAQCGPLIEELGYDLISY